MNENMETNNVNANNQSLEQAVQNPQVVNPAIENIQAPFQPVQNTSLGQQQNINIQPVEPMVDQVTQNEFGMPAYDNKISNKGKYGLLAVIGVLIIVLVSIISYYFISSNNPTNFYRGFIKKGIDEIFAVTEVPDKMKTSLKLDMDLDLEDDLLDSKIIDLINKTTLDIDVQLDKKAEQILLNVDSDYGKDSLLDLLLYVDNDEEETYLYAKDFYNKYLEVPVDDYSEISELFTSEDPFDEIFEDKNKIEKILKKELVAIISNDDCYKEDGYFVLELTEEKLSENLLEVLKKLNDNKDFINSFEDSESVKENLENMIDSYDSKYLSEEELKIAIKKTMFTNKIEELIFEYDGTKVEFIADGETYSYEVNVEDEKVLSGTVKIAEEKDTIKTEIAAKIPEVGKIEVNLESTYVEGKNIDKVNVSNAKSIEKLTEEEQTEIMTKIEESKLYELIAPLLESDNDNYYNDDYNDESDINSNVSTNYNEVKLYGSGQKISYNVPSGYKLSYNKDSYKSYEKDGIEVSVIPNYYESVDEYLNDLENDLEYMDTFQNVNLSDRMSKIVNGKTFYYRTLSYDYAGFNTTKYYETYIIIPINDDDSLTIEVSSADEQITESDLNAFLTISY